MIKSVSKKLKEPLFVISEENPKSPQILSHDTVFCIDGYDFGDRLLEGLMFKAKLSEDRKTITVFDVSNVSYLESLNASKWMKAALNYFIEGVDYVFPDGEVHETYWVLLSESKVKDCYPKLRF